MTATHKLTWHKLISSKKLSSHINTKCTMNYDPNSHTETFSPYRQENKITFWLKSLSMNSQQPYCDFTILALKSLFTKHNEQWQGTTRLYFCLCLADTFQSFSFTHGSRTTRSIINKSCSLAMALPDSSCCRGEPWYRVLRTTLITIR